jgi:hypothetical protein
MIFSVSLLLSLLITAGIKFNLLFKASGKVPGSRGLKGRVYHKVNEERYSQHLCYDKSLADPKLKAKGPRPKVSFPPSICLA